jgi:hypothetical protein
VWFELPVDVPVDLAIHAPPMHGHQRIGSGLPLGARSERFDGRETFVLQLLDTPVSLMQRATEHYESLFREFRLITERDPYDTHTVPRRLRDLIGALGTQYSGFGVPASRQWREAVAAGRSHVDLRVALPVQTAKAVELYNQLLDEADEHCRAADLITLPTEADCVALRRWVLRETARQGSGLPPQRWDGDGAAPLPDGQGVGIGQGEAVTG